MMIGQLVHLLLGGRKPRPRRLAVPGVTPATCARVEAAPDDLAVIWQASRSALAEALPKDWSDLETGAQAWLFATALAHNLKPYGPGPNGTDLNALLSARFLDCSTYGLLTQHFVDLMAPGPGAPRAAFVGWHGGAIGNHQWLQLELSGGNGLMLDPTFGVAARASFDQIASGEPIAEAAVIELSSSPFLAPTRGALIDAITAGSCRPSDLLYYFETREQLLGSFGHASAWPTPGAALWRAEARQAAGRSMSQES